MTSFELDSAIAAYRQTRLMPGDPNRMDLAAQLAHLRGMPVDWLNLAFEQFSAFRFQSAHDCLTRSLELQSDLLPARWLRLQLPMFPAPDSSADAEAFRQRWSHGLEYFESLDLSNPEIRRGVLTCLSAATSFYRHYLGDDCQREQRRYGALCARALSRTAPVPSAPQLDGGRKRLIVCSSFFYQHTVARLFLPLIEDLDPERFEIHLLHLGGQIDELTSRAGRAGRLHVGPYSPLQWIQLTQALRPDHMLFLDVGMDPTTQILAACRLAPIQSMLWGHPVTTGLPTMDYFISPSEGEQEGAESHYSEHLVRQPGLGHGLSFALSSVANLPNPTPTSGLRLFCGQTVYKFLPEFDELLAQLLADLPDAELHLIPHHEHCVREWLRTRIVRAFESAGVEHERRIHIHPHLPQQEYLSLAASCHINLDTPGWSGGMSSADLIGIGLPTVTLEGPLMRSRLTAALLRRCGRPDLIATDTESYRAIVLRLASDRNSLISQRASLRDACRRIDDRSRVSSALADFLRQPSSAAG